MGRQSGFRERASNADHRGEFAPRGIDFGGQLDALRPSREPFGARGEVRHRVAPGAVLELHQPHPELPAAARLGQQRVDREAEAHGAATPLFSQRSAMP